MDKPKVNLYKIIEIKPGVYLKDGGSGLVCFTDDVNEAILYKTNDYKNTSDVAKHWFGEVKTLKITSEVL